MLKFIISLTNVRSILITFLNKQDVKIKSYSLQAFFIIKIACLHESPYSKTAGIRPISGTVGTQIKYVI